MVRNASQNDRLNIGNIYCHSWKEAYKNIMPYAFLDSLTPEKSAPPHDISEKDNLLYEENGEVVGLVNFGKARNTSSDEKTGEIRSIYVLPKYWRRGIGRELFFAAAEKLKSDGYEEFCLWVLKDNMRARLFYRRMGMTPAGEERMINLAGTELSEIKYKFTF